MIKNFTEFKLHESNNSYEKWEEDLIDGVASMMECDYGDASGIVDAQSTELSNCWDKKMNPKETAKKIVKLSSK